MASLITPTQVNDIINNQSSTNFDLTLVPEQYIYDAQRLHIKPFLKEDLYDNFIQNYTDAKYVNLLDGEEYTYSSNAYTFEGIKYAIACYAMIQSLPYLHTQIRDAGIVINSPRYSNQVTAEELGGLKQELITKGQYYLDATKTYLDRNTDTFTLWQGVGVHSHNIGGILLKTRSPYVRKENEDY